jgi:glycosyltransferase involved in cell wall biosynthesis
MAEGQGHGWVAFERRGRPTERVGNRPQGEGAKAPETGDGGASDRGGMNEPRRVLIVVPAWNEEESVGLVVKEALAAVPNVRVVVVDDGSTDRTAEVARSAGATVLSVPFNLGVGGAMRTGFRYAVEEGFDVVVQVDADGQHDTREVGGLLDALGDEPAVVIGARFAGRGDFEVKGPRRWAMRMLAAYMSRLAGTRLTDVTSGFRAANRPAVELFARCYPAEYLLDTVESLVIAIRAGCRVTQVAVPMRSRRAGMPSQSTGRSLLYLLRAVFALVMSILRR